jgi:predicted ArsR family transcriptional regulator
MPDYQFLTNHAQVLLCVAHDPGIRLRDIAQTVGVTERSAHRIVSQLVADGYVVRERIGRRNVYRVRPELPLHHPLAQETEQRRVGDLLEVLLGEDGRDPARGQRQRTVSSRSS